MNIGDNTRPLLIDLDLGVVGTYIRETEDIEPEFVRILYVPLGSFPPKIVKYDKGVRNNHVFRVHYRSGMQGVQPECVLIHRGEDNSQIQVLNKTLIRQIEELRERLKSEQAEKRALKQEVEDMSAGRSKEEARRRTMERKENAITKFKENVAGLDV